MGTTLRGHRKSPTSRKGREKWGTRLGLTVGVFGTLGMHSPKVPHPDFSVQVVRHNLKIFFLWKTSEGKRLRDWKEEIGVSSVCPRICLQSVPYFPRRCKQCLCGRSPVINS